MVDYSHEPVLLDERYTNLLLPNNVTATAVRLTFSNRYGNKAVLISQVRVNGKPVSFGGASAALISAGGQETSGVTKVALTPGEPVSVSFQVGGDRFSTGFYRDNPRQIGVAYLCAVEARVASPAASVVCIGDSLTAQCRWFTPLQRKLYDEFPGEILMHQCGINGNRLLFDTAPQAQAGQKLGMALLRRFVPDAIAPEKPDLIILNAGINDLFHDEYFKAPLQRAGPHLMQGAFHALMEETQNAGCALALCTIPPFGQYECWNRDMEQRRNEVNYWIRTASGADYVLEFDGVLRQQSAPSMLDSRYDNGDGLHHNDEGGNAIARHISKQIDFENLRK